MASSAEILRLVFCAMTSTVLKWHFGECMLKIVVCLCINQHFHSHFCFFCKGIKLCVQGLSNIGFRLAFFVDWASTCRSGSSTLTLKVDGFEKQNPLNAYICLRSAILVQSIHEFIRWWYIHNTLRQLIPVFHHSLVMEVLPEFWCTSMQKEQLLVLFPEILINWCELEKFGEIESILSFPVSCLYGSIRSPCCLLVSSVVIPAVEAFPHKSSYLSK